ncbi:hypothetical protein KC19_7G129300 [Ceratodon purpureus]|uniref:JmjC domain-containing protein n=1 Tax=Ceratodon purpureus TaxID=3225 RepID=A0A8T0H7Y5_CERPU|nr:hypothetical protein KC19_7G129300 [Ceratodon purpureus]
MDQGGVEQTRRSKRQRVAVDYARLDTSGFADCIRVQHKKLARAVVKFSGQPQEETFAVCTVAPSDLAAHVHSTGFANPCVVRASEDSRSVLGIRVPEGELTVDRVAELVGRNRQVNTIDVSTQSEGPVYTMDELAAYFASPSPRKPLLNVVSLDLANTLLHDLVSAPSLVQDLDLVNKAWPPSQAPTPMVQLYALLSVSGCFMDFHIDFGGSSVWYHVLSGSKVFLLVPPTKANLMAFEEWSSSDRQVSVFFADRVTGCQKLELTAGDTLMLPGGWAHCVVTPEDSLVLGGNFLTGYNLPLQLDIWQMEERLKVRSKFRFPLYKQLMWHTAAYYLTQLRPASDVTTERTHSLVSKWEKEGLVNLCVCLQSWLRQSKDGGDSPSTLDSPTNLVKELEDCLKREGFVGPAADSRAAAKLRLMLRPLSAERPVSQWPTLAEDEDSDEEKGPDDKDDGEFDPAEDVHTADEDDVDFYVEEIRSPWSKRQRTPASKKPERKTFVVSPPPKPPVVLASPRAHTTPKKNTKSNSSVRDRLLKKCGLDPRIPLPTPVPRPKEDR